MAHWKKGIARTEEQILYQIRREMRIPRRIPFSFLQDVSTEYSILVGQLHRVNSSDDRYRRYLECQIANYDVIKERETRHKESLESL